jgi:hypothetical protein
MSKKEIKSNTSDLKHLGGLMFFIAGIGLGMAPQSVMVTIPLQFTNFICSTSPAEMQFMVVK